MVFLKSKLWVVLLDILIKRRENTAYKEGEGDVNRGKVSGDNKGSGGFDSKGW